MKKYEQEGYLDSWLRVTSMHGSPSDSVNSEIDNYKGRLTKQPGAQTSLLERLEKQLALSADRNDTEIIGLWA